MIDFWSVPGICFFILTSVAFVCFLSASSTGFVCISKAFPIGELVFYTIRTSLLYNPTLIRCNISSPVRYSYLSILPDDNADIFAASLLLSYCTFL